MRIDGIIARVRTGYRNLKLKKKILLYHVLMVLVITIAASFFAAHLVEQRVVRRFGEQNARSMEIMSSFLGDMAARLDGKFRALDESASVRALLAGDASQLRSVEALLARQADDIYLKEAISNQFRKEMSITITEYITACRMRAAVEIIGAEPETTLVDVAQRVGYRDPFFFSKSFKKCYGVTPKRYTPAG